MKKKAIAKLVLKKTVISQLTKGQENQVIGGSGPGCPTGSCRVIDCPITQSATLNCASNFCETAKLRYDGGNHEVVCE